MQEKIDENPLYGDDMMVDHSKIKFTLYLGYALKIIRLMIIIFNIAFFIGIFFLSFCMLKQDYEVYKIYGTIHGEMEVSGTFLAEYDMD